VNFRGERRVNETHQSTTDPEARLMRSKGKESKLSYPGHVLMENRNGLVVDARPPRPMVMPSVLRRWKCSESFLMDLA